MKLVQVQVRKSSGELVAFSQRNIAPNTEIWAWAKKYAHEWVQEDNGRFAEVHTEESSRFLLQAPNMREPQ